MKQSKYPQIAFMAALVSTVALFTSCPGSSGGEDPVVQYSLYPVPVSYNAASLDYEGGDRIIGKITNETAPTDIFNNRKFVSVEVKGLTGQNVFLVRSNISGSVVGAIPSGSSYTNTGGTVYWDLDSAGSNSFRSAASSGSEPPLYAGFAEPVSMPAAASSIGFTRVDPPRSFLKAPKSTGARAADPSVVSAFAAGPFTEDQVGTATCEVNAWTGNDASTITVTLYARGEHCYVWMPAERLTEVEDENGQDNMLTHDQLSLLAVKFDAIYDKETTLFGHENGGGLEAGEENYGGCDEDPRIHIVAFDIAGDYAEDQYSGVYGYFDSGDQDAGYIDGNLAEMFYVDSHFLDASPGVMYSTLIHEFQHMIHYARKGVNSETWYNEMLSMVAEDLILPMIDEAGDDIDIERDGPAAGRIPYFNTGYNWSGVTDWYDGEDENVLISYASAYSFGSYIARNFGGPALIKAIIDNSSQGKESVGTALKATAPDSFPAALTDSGAFSRAFSEYWQVLFFDSSDASAGFRTFDATPPSLTLDSYTYALAGFDLWSFDNYNADYTDSLPVLPQGYKGPTIYSIDYFYSHRPWSFMAFSHDDWTKVSGDLTITVDITELDPAFELYIAVK
ncbi:MAG TPA: hypothetical protein PL077_06555 [Treponemataceae bacterium]|nr:hypothetical protein [Treponemataceae bacterium]